MSEVIEEAMETDRRIEPIRGADPKRIWLRAGAPGAILWILALVLWAQHGLDHWALFAFNPARVSGVWWVRIAGGLTGYGLTGIALLYVLYYLVQASRPGWNAPRTLYLYVLLSLALSGVTGDLLKMVFDRPRPSTTFGDQIFTLSTATSQALPSGHATKAFALALPALFLVGRGSRTQTLWTLLVGALALGVAASRVVLGAHYVSDVVAGIGMACIGFPFVALLARRILAGFPAHRLPTLARKWVVVLAGLSVAFLYL